MKTFFTADLETDPFKAGRRVKAFASAVHDGKTTVLFWGVDCIQKLLTFLRDKDGICFLHNGGRFDIHHLLKFMQTRDIDPTPRLIGGRVVSLRWRGIDFRDSYALVPKPLKSWQKDDIKIWKLNTQHRQKYREEICSYLRGDVRFLHEMMSEMLTRYAPKGPVPLTLAGLTFKIMEKDFGIKIVHTPRSFDRKMRPYYFGGRVQFWRLGRIVGNMSIVDINSAYPRAMTEKHFWGAGMKISAGKGKIDPHSFYRIETEKALGYFPLRTRDGLEFPIGAGDFRVTGWELQTFPGKYKILTRICPKKLVTFKAYTLHFYGLKEHATDKAERYFAKIILNSFYGKLAQNDANYKETLIREYRDWPKGKGWELVADDKESGRSIFQKPAPKIQDPFCVATGASITGWVRAELSRVIAKNPDVVYCDTDSLIAPRPVIGCDIGSGLGQWKLEMHCDVIWVAGKKLYAAHNAEFEWHKSKPSRTGWIHVPGMGWTSASPEAWKCAAKGVRLPIKDIIAIAEGHTRTYSQSAPSYSLGREEKFIRRTIRRSDKR